MIAMVVNSQYRCLVMSDLPPVYKSDGHSADDYTGCDTLDHVSEGQDVWKAAIDNCLSEKVDTSCEFCNEYNSVVSRWRATMRYLETDRVLVTIRRVPSAIHELSDRERDVLNEVARGKTNAQVAESLGISLSTAVFAAAKQKNDKKKLTVPRKWWKSLSKTIESRSCH